MLSRMRQRYSDTCAREVLVTGTEDTSCMDHTSKERFTGQLTLQDTGNNPTNASFGLLPLLGILRAGSTPMCSSAPTGVGHNRTNRRKHHKDIRIPEANALLNGSGLGNLGGTARLRKRTKVLDLKPWNPDHPAP